MQYLITLLQNWNIIMTLITLIKLIYTNTFELVLYRELNPHKNSCSLSLLVYCTPTLESPSHINVWGVNAFWEASKTKGKFGMALMQWITVFTVNRFRTHASFTMFVNGGNEIWFCSVLDVAGIPSILQPNSRYNTL